MKSVLASREKVKKNINKETNHFVSKINKMATHGCLRFSYFYVKGRVIETGEKNIPSVC